MKCSICNAENPPDATSCHQCGFSFSLSQPTWPDFPTLDVPEPADTPQWPELPEVEVPPAGPVPPWPEDGDLMTTMEGAEVESVEEGARVEIELPSLDDDLARAHIRRGFEAIREGLPDQAKWEFEQARDLADDTDIVGMAQAQLSELSGTPEEIVQEHVRPIEGPIPASTSTPISVRIKTTDWSPVIRIGLIIGTLNGVLTGCGAILCLGFLLAPAAGFAAGWMTARKDSTADTAHKSGQSSDVIPAIIAGGITGLGGWLGEIIGHPIWVASTSSSRTDPLTTGLVVACMPGTLYVLMAIAASVFGWRTGTRKQHRSP